jgi:hypothetical protein
MKNEPLISLQRVSEGELALRLENADILPIFEESVSQILPLIEARLQSELAQRHLGSEIPLNRFRAILAVEMLVEEKLGEAIRLLTALQELAQGERPAADFGFPEFGDEASSEWAE